MDLEELQQLHTRRRHLFRNNTSLSDCLHFALEDMLPLLGPWQTDDHLPAEAGDDGVIDQVAAVGSPDDPDAGVTPLPSHSARKGLHNFIGHNVGCGRSTLSEHPLALMEENHGWLILPGVVPDLAHALPACSEARLLEIGERQLLEVRIQRRCNTACDRARACKQRTLGADLQLFEYTRAQIEKGGYPFTAALKA